MSEPIVDDVCSIDSSCNSDSTESEERLRRLFESCDRDKDGLIDSKDLFHMCKQLNMEQAFEDMMQQLNLTQAGHASFQDFMQCRQRLIDEIEQEKLETSRHQLEARGRQHAWNTDSEHSSAGVQTTSQDYDSGARDMSPEPRSLYTLLEKHNRDYLHQITHTQYGPAFLDVANMLHLTALTSLKSEVIELSNNLQRVTAEKQQLERQVNKQKVEKTDGYRDRLEEQTVRYEDRITELHGVIAELRRKLEARQFNIIREEDEVDPDKSQDGESLSANDNNANQSVATSGGAQDWETEMSQVINTFNRALMSQQQCLSPVNQQLAQLSGTASPIRTRSPIIPCSSSTGGASGVGVYPPQSLPIKHTLSPVNHPTKRLSSPHNSAYQQNVTSGFQALTSSHNICPVQEQIQYTANSLQEQIEKQQEQLERTNVLLRNVEQDRHRLNNRVKELETRLVSVDASSAGNSVHGTPTKTRPPPSPRGSNSNVEQSPGPKVAGLKKLKTSMTEDQPKHVLGVDLTPEQIQTAKVAEHLVHNLLDSSSIQEIVHTASASGQYTVSDNKIHEFEVEVERLQSKIDNLRAQNDLLTLTLEESKTMCNKLTELMGKYESNHTGLRLASTCSEQLFEAQEALVLLLDSQQSVLLANCKAAGLGSTATTDSGMGDDNEETTDQMHKAKANRKGAEHIAKQLIHRLDRSFNINDVTSHSQPISPWDELSSTSRTNSTTSSTGSAVDTEFSKLDERRLREHIKHLKHERASLHSTVVELESLHTHGDTAMTPLTESVTMDLENAVLMQELMAMKEDKSELRAQNYLLGKEKATLDLQLSGKESREQAYLVQIEHLKFEVCEWKQKLGMDDTGAKDKLTTPSITLAELRSQGLDSSQAARDLSEALKREEMLRKRVSELMATLDRLSKNAESRHNQSAEFVSDLKKANGALVSAFEKAKKNYQKRMKKMENQVEETATLYKSQIESLQVRLEQLGKCQGSAVT